MLYAATYTQQFNTKPDEKAYQRRLANALLAHALKAEFNLSLSALTVSRGEHGKPFFANSNVKFSVSHCDGAVCCAVSQREIGIDCERVRPFSQRLAQRICTKNELEIIAAADDKAVALTTLWSLKESRTKLSGEGIGFGMKNAEFTKSGGSFISAEKNISAAVLYTLPDIVVTACALGEAPTDIILADSEALL